jgi:hypothetical protein
MALMFHPGLTAADSEEPVGIAARYPGDTDIAKDADVLYFWDYENESEWRSPWGGKLSLYSHITEPANVRFGTGAIEAKLVAGSNGRGDAIRLPEGHDVLYQRYYAKFPAGFAPMPGHGFKLHGFAGVAADKPSWYAQGTAGIRPTGEDKMYAIMVVRDGILPGFYYYHPHQRGKWGDVANWGESAEPGSWHCYEFMTKVNDVGQSNGELACWIDGFEVKRVVGLQWRTVDTLKINLVLDHVYNQVPFDESAYFDNRVVAKKYIGPLAAIPVAPPKPEKRKVERPVKPELPAMDTAPHRDAVVQSLKRAVLDPDLEVSMNLLGKTEHVCIAGADDKGIAVSFRDNIIQVPWKSLANADLAKLAVAHLSSDADGLYHAGTLAVAGRDFQACDQIAYLLHALDAERAKALKALH